MRRLTRVTPELSTQEKIIYVAKKCGYTAVQDKVPNSEKLWMLRCPDGMFYGYSWKTEEQCWACPEHSPKYTSSLDALVEVKNKIAELNLQHTFASILLRDFVTQVSDSPSRSTLKNLLDICWRSVHASVHAQFEAAFLTLYLHFNGK